MSTQRARDGLLPGTLDLLILRTLEAGAEHGQGIAHQISPSPCLRGNALHGHRGSGGMRVVR